MDIRSARRWLANTESIGDCCCCGGGDGLSPAARVLGPAFSNYSALCIAPGGSICSPCASVIGDRTMRVYSIISLAPGTHDVATGQDIYNALLAPPDQFVVSVAYSRKKHHWLYAGLSTPQQIVVGTDDRSVVYDPIQHALVLATIVEAIAEGIPVTQLTSGRYHPTTYVKFGASRIERIETTISSHRVTGLVALLVKVAPRPEHATPIPVEATMIRPDDQAAAELIAAIAGQSQLRKDRGKDFWDGILLHRLNRVSRMPLDQAVARLMQWLGVPATDAAPIVELLEQYDQDTSAAVEKSITDRPQLIAALAYDQLKAAKGSKKPKPASLFGD